MSSPQQISQMPKVNAPMSIYVPHIDASYTFEDIEYQFEHIFEIGAIDRIEAVPKVNQKDGHAYYACFIYFSKWGNGYNAQYLRNQLMQGQQVRMYYLIDRYWMVCSNTSEVASLPMPKHCSLIVHMPWEFVENELIDRETGNCDIERVFDTMEFGAVESVIPSAWNSEHNDFVFEDVDHNIYSVERPYLDQKSEDLLDEPKPVHIQFKYWYHSKNAHDFQKDLIESGQVVFYPEIPGYPNMKWIIMMSDHIPTTTGKNPYIWYSEPSKYQTQNKHQHFMD